MVKAFRLDLMQIAWNTKSLSIYFNGELSQKCRPVLITTVNITVIHNAYFDIDIISQPFYTVPIWHLHEASLGCRLQMQIGKKQAMNLET